MSVNASIICKNEDNYNVEESIQSPHSPEDDQSILIETSSFNLQFFSELITTQLRDFHMVSPQVFVFLT